MTGSVLATALYAFFVYDKGMFARPTDAKETNGSPNVATTCEYNASFTAMPWDWPTMHMKIANDPIMFIPQKLH